MASDTAPEHEILHHTSSRLLAPPNPDYISLDKIQNWLTNLDKQFPKDIQLKGVSYDRASNKSLGFKEDGSDFIVYAPSPLIPSKKDDAGNIQAAHLEIRNNKTINKLTPSQNAFISVFKKGLEVISDNTDTILIDIATLPPTWDYFCEQCEDGSVMEGMAAALKSESLQKKKVVIRFLVGDPEAVQREDLFSTCVGIFLKFDQDNKNPEPKISHPNIELYVGFYSPNFEPKENTDVAAVKKFVSNVVNSSLLKSAKLASIVNPQDLIKMADDLLNDEHRKAVPSITWNHGKILAVNGQTLMTGGINYMGEYASTSAHDICDTSIKIQGDAAVSGHRWADYFWKYLAKPAGTDKISRFRGINISSGRSWYNWDDNLTSIPDSQQYSKSISEKNFETLSIARLGDWYGSMKEIQYPVQIIDCLRDVILEYEWQTFNRSGYNWLISPLFLAMVGFLSDDSLATFGYLQELGINPTAWASRYARAQAIGTAKDSVVISQQMLVQGLSTDKDEFKTFVYKVNARLTGKVVKDPPDIKKVTWNVPWNGHVWAYDLLLALAKALGNMSKSTKPDLSENGKQFRKESKGIFIVLTTDKLEGSHPDGWQDKTSIAEFLARLKIVMQSLPTGLGGITPASKIDDVIRDLVHIRRTSTSKTPAGSDLYNHSKVVVVDGRVMYVGSDNAYPGYNEEHGVWIEDQPTIGHYLDDFMVDFWSMCEEPTTKDLTGK